MGKIEIECPEENVEAEVADSFLSRAKGLSFRTEGKMLFVFPRDTRATIDMMLVSKSLNLYFLNSEKEVIDVQEAKPWSFDPRTWKLYRPETSYRFLLESFEDLEIEEGEKLEFEI